MVAENHEQCSLFGQGQRKIPSNLANVKNLRNLKLKLA
jgi:hypothetical protein